MSQIVLEELSFRHEVDYPLISSLSYVFKTPQHYAIVGPSGCGKTTLLHLIGSLIVPDSGKCFYHQDTPPTGRPHFSYVFTRPFLIRELSVYNNIVLGLSPDSSDKELLLELLERFDIAGYQQHYPDQLSSGQQQRVAVLRALLRKSEFVLADEPAAHLDLARGTVLMEQMQSVLREQNRGLICVTHQQQWLSLFDDVLELSRNK